MPLLVHQPTLLRRPVPPPRSVAARGCARRRGGAGTTPSVHERSRDSARLVRVPDAARRCAPGHGMAGAH